MKVIRGKKAIVTGAGSGIGRAIALALAREGADLCLVGRDEAKLKATAAATSGVETMIVAADLADPAAATTIIETVKARWGRLDILVNNAGVTYYGPTLHMKPEQIERIVATNLLAPMRLVHAALPILVKQRDGHILNVSSIFGLVTLRKGVVYQTTKFGLVGFSQGLRADVWRGGIGVTALCPGFVRTPMLDYEPAAAHLPRHKIPDWASTTPERVAEVAVNAIRRDRGLVVPWGVQKPLWWLARLSPGLVDWMLREGWRSRKR